MNNLPDFSKFKLDDFSLNKKASEASPAPHKLREARRSFVLYLEPAHESTLYKSMTGFQEKTQSQFGPNQAHNTPPHVSVLPRILIEKDSSNDISNKWQVVNNLIDSIDNQVNNLQLHGPEFAGYQILDKPSRSLVMNVKIHEDYSILVDSVEKEVGPTCALLETNLLDKIHLAYNVLKSPSKSDLKKIRDLAESTIDIHDWIKTGGVWRLTLYEIMIESQVVGIQHQLKQIHSWSLYPRSSHQFADFLPVSVRIKLPWLNNSSKKPSQPSPVDNSSTISRKTTTSSNKGAHGS